MANSRVYFAHPVSMYNQPIETRIVEYMEGLGCIVVNPNDKLHEKKYKKLGMAYFVELCETCDACVFSTFDDGTVGAGVAKEVMTFLKDSLDVWHVTCHGKMVSVSKVTDLTAYKILTKAETRAKLKSLGVRK